MCSSTNRRVPSLIRALSYVVLGPLMQMSSRKVLQTSGIRESRILVMIRTNWATELVAP